jgi:hypothetical protein
MSKKAASLQEQCSFCQHQHESDQVYATFVSSDWRTPFLEYLIENIWILVATEYFSKWVEAIPLRKTTGVAVANFICEHIITRFGILHKIISDNSTPFINKSVREILEHY